MEIKIDGIFNARDLGGMETKDGLVVKPGRLIRSDNLSNLTRTGFLTALLLELFGVDRKVIEKDFLLSGENLKPQTEGILAEIKKETDDPELIEQVRILNSVLPEYTATVFDGIDKNGGIENYLTQHIGLSNSDLNDLRRLYLV